VVTVIVNPVVADFRLSSGQAQTRSGTFVIVAVCIVVAIIVDYIVTDLGSARIDGGIVVVAVDCATCVAFNCEPVTVVVSTTRAGTEIGWVMPRITICLTFRVQWTSATGVDVTQVTPVTRTARAVYTVKVTGLSLYRAARQQTRHSQKSDQQSTAFIHALFSSWPF
jgi:hypothetical protein